MKFRYTGIRVTNLERSVMFYTATMGMQEIHRGQMQAGGIYVHLRSPGSEQDLELNYYPPDTTYFEPYQAGSECDHLAFWSDDVHADYAKTLAGGATSAIAPWTESGYTLTFIRDPDGIWIELMGKAR